MTQVLNDTMHNSLLDIRGEGMVSKLKMNMSQHLK